MNDDYARYVDDVLVALADHQTGPNLVSVNLDDLHHEFFRDRPQTWLQTLVPELTRRGYGDEPFDAGNARMIRITGAGLSRVAEIRTERAPKNVVQKLTSDTSQKLVNVVNMSIALLALIVAIFALVKPSH